MNHQLEEKGFIQNYFPFSKSEIEELRSIASKASELTPNDRKNLVVI